MTPKLPRTTLLLLPVVLAGCPEKPSGDPAHARATTPVAPRSAPAAQPTATAMQRDITAQSNSAPASASATPPTTVIPDDMLGVPGGRFPMGQDDIGEKDERPRHDVRVSAFLLDKTEVTNEAYYRCVEAKVCRPHSAASAEANKLGNDKKFRTPTRPISGVSHDDAEAYCRWVGKRLPTEAEWERAARGSDGRLYPWGSEEPTHELAVFSGGVTQPVGSKPKGAGPYGHLDLAGNVWEWVADRYDPYAYRRETASRGVPGSCDEILKTQAELRKGGMDGFTGTNPIPDECEFVLRGGAFNYGGKGLRCSNRVHHPGRYRLVMSGFRCARDWPDGPVDPVSPGDAGATADAGALEGNR
jgi:formylglycine-generating enzyme required for sulfatase activity